MNRRNFCKIGAMAMGALGLGVLDAKGALSPGVGDGVLRVEKPFRITVIRRECYEDMQSLYLDDPEVGLCSVFESGEVRTFEMGDTCPADFCHKAWRVIIECVNASHVCADMRENVALVSCPDGSRPVIFKVEF